MKGIVVGARDLEGHITWHAQADAAGCYDTLCGISLSDTEFVGVVAKPKQKVECAACFMNWQAAQPFKESDFKVQA